MTWATVDEIIQEDKKHKIAHLDELKKVRKDVTGLTCNSFGEAEWVRLKLKDEWNKWVFAGVYSPPPESSGGHQFHYREFTVETDAQPRKHAPVPLVNIETGVKELPRIRIDDRVLPDEFDEVHGRVYRLEIVNGEVKMNRSDTAACAH